jgi:ribosome maturation protein SDO1
MVSVEDAVISRLSIKGQNFEVLVDPNKALEIKKGKKIDEDALAYPEIYRDVRKAMRASEEDLEKVFGTTDVLTIAEKIIRHGKLQLTTEQRRKLVEEKKNQIAHIISRKGINPQTGTPHPPQRILNAMEEAGVNIDPFIDAELQVDKVLKAIKPLIPINLQRYTIQLRIPVEYTGKIYSVLKSFTTIINEKWLGDGSLEATVVIPAGIQDELYSKIASLTKGNFESKIVKKEEI